MEAAIDSGRGGHFEGGIFNDKQPWKIAHHSPTASPLIPAVRGDGSGAVGGEGHHHHHLARWEPLSPLSVEDGTADDIVRRWVSASAPQQVTMFLRSLITGNHPASPTLELVNAAGACDPRTGLCGWETWVTPSAPAAVQNAFSAWLLGKALSPTPATTAYTPETSTGRGHLSTEEYSIPSAAASDNESRNSWRSQQHTNAEAASPSATAPSTTTTESTSSDFSFAPRLHSNHGLRAWVSGGASTAVKSSVLRWAETAAQPASLERRTPTTAPHSNADRRQSPLAASQRKANFSPTEGTLGPVIGAPLPTAGSRHVDTELEAKLVSALLLMTLPANASARADADGPRVICLWGACGSGKSTASVTAVHAPSVRRGFPGGIVWLDATTAASEFSSSTSEAVALLSAAAVAVDALPSNGPLWPPLSLVQPSPSNIDSISESDLRAWLGVRLRALRGHCLFVVDGVSSGGVDQSRLSGLVGLGASLLLIADSPAAFSPAIDSSIRNKIRVEEVCANDGLSERQAVILLLVAAGCRLDEMSREAAAGLVGASSRLPAELLLLAGVARGRAAMQQLPCRAADLRALATELLRQARAEPIVSPVTALSRTVKLAVSELTPRDETLLLRLGAVWPQANATFSLSLMRALWVGGGGPEDLPDSTEAVLSLIGRLERRSILIRDQQQLPPSSDDENEKNDYGWRMHAFLLRYLAGQLRRDSVAFEAAEARLTRFRQRMAMNKHRVKESETDTQLAISSATLLLDKKDKGARSATPPTTETPTVIFENQGRRRHRSGDERGLCSSTDEHPTLSLQPSTRDSATSPSTPPLLLGAGSRSSTRQVRAVTCENTASLRESPLSGAFRTSASWESQQQAGSSAESTATLYYSDRGELLEVMEETLRSRVGEGAVSLLPPSPTKVAAMTEPGEDLHYHYHYHSSAASTPTSSPARRPPASPSSPRSSGIFNVSRLSGISSPGEWPLSSPSSPVTTTPNRPARQAVDRKHGKANNTPGPSFLAQTDYRTPLSKLDLNNDAFGEEATNIPSTPQRGEGADDEALESWPASPISSPSRRRRSDDITNALSLSTQRMLQVHISPYLPVWDKPTTAREAKELSDVTRSQVFEYAKGVMLEPRNLST